MKELIKKWKERAGRIREMVDDPKHFGMDDTARTLAQKHRSVLLECIDDLEVEMGKVKQPFEAFKAYASSEADRQSALLPKPQAREWHNKPQPPKSLAEEQWQAPDLSFLSLMELVMLLQKVAKESDGHWADRKFSEAISKEIASRKPFAQPGSVADPFDRDPCCVAFLSSRTAHTFSSGTEGGTLLRNHRRLG